MNKVCSSCIGFAMGLAAGMIIACIPQVRSFAQDMKFIIEKDVVRPVQKMMKEKSDKMEEIVGE